MKPVIFLTIIVLSCGVPFLTFSQSNFSVQEYTQFLQDNQNLTGDELLARYAPQNVYYKGIENTISLSEYSYLDTIITKYALKESELKLLQKNHFMVSERLNSECFGQALHDIYSKDLPVFVSTDAILHALHSSYDKLLMDIEIEILEPNLVEFLDALESTFPQLINKYDIYPKLRQALSDVDLYVTIARSLLAETKLSPQYESASNVDAVWEAIQSEQLVNMPLFSARKRQLDFSQFTVRGHYTWKKTLGKYFKCMMWLGRMDFLLTPPPENPWEPSWGREEIRRMNLGAVLLNELVELSGTRSLLNQNDEIITFMVGESDNLTPAELANIVNEQQIPGANALLDDPTYDAFQGALKVSAGSGQLILSSFMLMDPFSTEPDTLPISFRLMGQRFIIDSYIFSNVVYDRIIFENQKVWRPLPEPLDAMFVLGNDDALPLLKQELDRYKYSSQLAALRYLVDAYDDGFWELSLYNVWLQAIRLLNPLADRTGFPLFMYTAAWQQEKLNSQLSSWAQLRHDNLLYAKQSYTSAAGCSFPHSFIEPYPAFYRQIAAFAEKAGSYFSNLSSESWTMNGIKQYFPRLKNVMLKLEIIAQKELDRKLLNDEEVKFLRKMLFIRGGSGAPPFSGWFADLFYLPEDAAIPDYLVADVHTQPTDQAGNIVGRILHVGVGKINLGVFLADSPSDDYQPMAFVGPVMSYYEKITENFDRLTDERWKALVESDGLPARPDWVNIYLADSDGSALQAGRELPGEMYTGLANKPGCVAAEFTLAQNFPNPFNPCTTIRYNVPRFENVTLIIYDVLGRKIETLVDKNQPAGQYAIQWHTGDLPSGLYFCRIRTGAYEQTIKMLLMR